MVVGVPLAIHGGDHIGTGLSRIWGVGNGRTATYQGFETLTGSAAIARAVDQGIPFLAGVASVGQGLRLAEERVFNNTVYRGLTPRDAAALDDGLGLTAKNPNGIWTPEEHVLNYSRRTIGNAQRHDPWIGTTRDYDVVTGPGGYDSGNGIVAINLNKVPNAQVALWPTAPRTASNMAYHRSFWSQEVSIYQSVPSQAIYTPFSPINQVSVSRPITYGLTLGGTGFTNNHGGSR